MLIFALLNSCSQRFLPAEYVSVIAKKPVKCPDLSHYDKTIKPYKDQREIARLGLYCKMHNLKH
jgi:hypothetical protein